MIVDIQYMVITDSEYKFPIFGTTKTSKEGKRVLDITFHIFPEESLYPYKTLGHYFGCESILVNQLENMGGWVGWGEDQKLC